MKIKQILLKDIRPPDIQDEAAQVVLIFAKTSLIRQALLFDELRLTYLNAIILGCSTSGEIYDTKVYDNTISFTAGEIEGAKQVSELPTHFGETLSITGGLAGDADRLIANGPPRKGIVAALGFYGTRLNVGFGSLGGWDSFGPERIITKAKGNSLYDIDGQSAQVI